MFNKYFGLVLLKVGQRLTNLSGRFCQSEREKNAQTWFQNNGNMTYRLNYELNANSIVFDLGGYEGQWASDIFAKYCCTVHVFEPVPEFTNSIKQRFAQNPNIIVHQFGLSDRDQIVQIHFDRNQSSMYTSGTDVREAKLINAKKFIDSEGIEHIDLMKINIEGGEYDLLDHLIHTALVKQIANIQVQFHDHVPNAEKRIQKIQQALQKTHYLTYQYPFVWENWKRIEPTDAQQNL